MSEPVPSPPPYPGKPGDLAITKSSPSRPIWKKWWIWLCALLIIAIAIGLGVGLGLGLRPKNEDNDSGGAPPNFPGNNNTNATSGALWTPGAGTTWQIVLQHPLTDFSSPSVSAFDIDLFDNDASIITALHDKNRKVICYFSAGSYENWRSDASQFKKEDYGKKLDGWPGEFWVDTNSNNVRNIMSARLALAASKGCDGVDPDNVDGYDHDTGFSLTTASAINYLTFLAQTSHKLNMSIGLKNADRIVSSTVDTMQWVVTEQCGQYNECAAYQPFIAAGKPVFRIEYPNSAPSISTDTKNQICSASGAQGFSTVIKKMDLDDWVEFC
ncbi:hypothetical protein HYFRA_00001175 [Hymenoscyphus fraxineus]|uniref:alpha-galactosidase n=1 Tax=Hymenoscyphus fraxineus TaxID=746836 RepID=A0A9N9KT14_9HELO|nr:hypothetical protein HYFRA_00001175 [Hymenoscyphus fraxineus]